MSTTTTSKPQLAGYRIGDRRSATTGARDHHRSSRLHNGTRRSTTLAALPRDRASRLPAPRPSWISRETAIEARGATALESHGIWSHTARQPCRVAAQQLGPHAATAIAARGSTTEARRAALDRRGRNARLRSANQTSPRGTSDDRAPITTAAIGATTLATSKCRSHSSATSARAAF